MPLSSASRCGGICRFLAVVVAVLAIMAPSAPVAQYGNETPVSMPQALTDSEIDFVTAYWTPERMREAIPMPMPVPRRNAARDVAATEADGGNGPVLMATSGRPGELPQEKWVTDEETEMMASAEIVPRYGRGQKKAFTRYRLFPDDDRTYKTWPNSATGKLFFKKGSASYVCSASVINSANGRVVWTAGHCVYSPGYGWHTNFLFAPARRNGRNPLGTWTAATAYTLVGWQNNHIGYDLGALVMNRGGKGGKGYPAAKLGYLGWVYNQKRKQHHTAIGWPAAARNLNKGPIGKQFDGEHMELCYSVNGRQDKATGGAPKPMGMACDMTGGSSGGPWVIDRNPEGGYANLVNGVNSYGYNNDPLTMYSPYHGTGAKNLRDAAQNH